MVERTHPTGSALRVPVAQVRYRVEVSFLGPAAVTADPANYRCTFELERSAPGTAQVLAAGAAIDPGTDATHFRLLIRDHHAVTYADGFGHGGTGLLGSGGDATSKPANYRTHGWLKDVRPLVGFRVKVTKRAHGVRNPLPFDQDEVSVVWTVKDAGEQPVDGAPHRPQAVVGGIVRRFRRDANTAGDDNCPTDFGGSRARNDVVDATAVLVSVAPADHADATQPRAWATPVALARAASDPQDPPRRGHQGGGAGAAPDTHAGKRAQSPLVVVADAHAPFAYTDVFFYPQPVSGDDYSLELVLVRGGGVKAPMQNAQGSDLPAFAIGPITLWRKVPIDLVATCGNASATAIDWDRVKATYAPAYIEIDGPRSTYAVPLAEWQHEVIDALAAKNIVADASAPWGDFFFPPLRLPPVPPSGTPPPRGWITASLANMAAKSAAANILENHVLPTFAGPPGGLAQLRTDNAGQDDPHGLAVLLVPALGPDSASWASLGGSYFGEREFLMCDTLDTTLTFAHELGHALYLRHGLTHFMPKDEHGQPLAFPIAQIDDGMFGTFLDHDQADSVNCVMSYGVSRVGRGGAAWRPDPPAGANAQAVDWHFCGGCLMKLRFWDTVAAQATPEWREVIVNTAAQAFPGAYDPTQVPKPLAAMDVWRQAVLVAFAPAEPNLNNLGGPYVKDVFHAYSGTELASGIAFALGAGTPPRTPPVASIGRNNGDELAVLLDAQIQYDWLTRNVPRAVAQTFPLTFQAPATNPVFRSRPTTVRVWTQIPRGNGDDLAATPVTSSVADPPPAP